MVLKLAHPALNLTLAIAWSLIYLFLLLDHSGRCKCSSRNRLRRNSTQFAACNYVFTFLWGFGAVGWVCQAQYLGQSWISSSGLGAVGGSTAGGTLEAAVDSTNYTNTYLKNPFYQKILRKNDFL